MSSGSVRSVPGRALRQHEDPPEESGRAAIPDARSEGNGDGETCPVPGRLWREGGKVMYQRADGGGPEAVRVLWARPLSGREGPVSIMLAGKKKELAYLPCLDALSEESRKVAREELANSIIMPRITAITRVRPRFDNYYWDVETDKGSRRFLLSSPENNVIRPMPDALVIKDVSGNCYEINPVSGLDRKSLQEMDRAL